MFNSRIDTSETEKCPNILHLMAVKESNVLLVLSTSVPETLVKHISFPSTSVSVPTLNRHEPVLNGCRELSSYFSCHQRCYTVCCYEVSVVGRITRSPHPALVHSELVFPFQLYSVTSRLKQ